MAEAPKKIMCCMLLLAIVGTASGAGYVAAEQAGFATPGKEAVADSPHGDSGLIRVIGQTGSTHGVVWSCHLPMWKQSFVAFCIMFCNLFTGGGKGNCALTCKEKYSTCYIQYL
jgi:hypothetical protein